MVKKIVVVDDEPGIAYTVKHGLEALDPEIQVTCVDSGEKCLELLKTSGIPDLILLDIMMPGMSGWETLKRIRAHVPWKGIPVVFLTARIDWVAKQAGGFLGEDYIEKPFKIPELKERVDKVLKR